MLKNKQEEFGRELPGVKQRRRSLRTKCHYEEKQDKWIRIAKF